MAIQGVSPDVVPTAVSREPIISAIGNQPPAVSNALEPLLKADGLSPIVDVIGSRLTAVGTTSGDTPWIASEPLLTADG
jgi:hypothetical protein